MWQEENIDDLFDAGMTNDKLALLYEINKTNEIAVLTPAGISIVKTVENIVCQGDPWGSIECSNMVDGFGKESLKTDLDPYEYKDKVKIPLLGMCDDMLCISKAGHQTQMMNSFINVKSAMKRLQYNPDKCHIMHIGKDIPEHKKMEMYVDGWKMREVTETNIETNDN